MCLILLSCSKYNNISFNGIVVDKEYVPKHNERRTRPMFTGKTTILIPYTVTVESKFKIWVADRNIVKVTGIDSLNYTKLSIGDKYEIK